MRPHLVRLRAQRAWIGVAVTAFAAGCGMQGEAATGAAWEEPAATEVAGPEERRPAGAERVGLADDNTSDRVGRRGACAGDHGCARDASCRDLAGGGYVCACNPGFDGDGRRCEPVCGALGACPPGFVCLDGSTCRDQQAGLVYVPKGVSSMGCDAADDAACDEDARPRRKVVLSAYAIDATEVTAGEYHECVRAGACTLPSLLGGLTGTYGSADRWDHPVNYVSWSQAGAYCEWPGKPAGPQRLCTEAEWERAARGGCETLEGSCDGGTRAWPWGAAPPTCDHAVFHDPAVGDRGCDERATLPVASRPRGASPYGALDMTGNVAEWVADRYGPYESAGTVDPSGAPGSTERVVRGGSFADDADGIGTIARAHAAPSSATDDRGFRCCASVDAVESGIAVTSAPAPGAP